MADELITKAAFDALTDTYIAHPLLCECPSCASMDDLLNAMCIRSGCRNSRRPGHLGCDDHPRRTASGARPSVRGGPDIGHAADHDYRHQEQNDRD